MLHRFLVLFIVNLLQLMSSLAKIRVISLDVTGTIITHRLPVHQTYSEAAHWARLPNAPSPEELKPAFKKAFSAHAKISPYYGYAESISTRQWWYRCVKSALQNCGRADYNDEEFDRFFRRIYQHYGSPEGYEVLPDAKEFLDWIEKDERGKRYSLGILTNSPIRTVETTVPLTGIHNLFQWFVSCQDIGSEKPDKAIFDRGYELAKYWIPDLQREEILHIGDNLAADFCGARAAGFQALYLDRSKNPKVTVYQDWLEAPDYPGKCDSDIEKWTVRDFNEVKDRLLLL